MLRQLDYTANGYVCWCGERVTDFRPLDDIGKPLAHSSPRPDGWAEQTRLDQEALALPQERRTARVRQIHEHVRYANVRAEQIHKIAVAVWGEERAGQAFLITDLIDYCAELAKRAEANA